MKLEAQKASVSIAFSKIDRSLLNKDFSCIYFSDLSTPLYRVTNQEHTAGLDKSKQCKLIFEMNFDFLQECGLETDSQIKSHLNQVLLKEGILKSEIPEDLLVIKSLKNAVNLPTLHNFNNFEKLFKATLEHYSEIELIGPASGMVSTSFNDQVVQALKLGAKYN